MTAVVTRQTRITCTCRRSDAGPIPGTTSGARPLARSGLPAAGIALTRSRQAQAHTAKARGGWTPRTHGLLHKAAPAAAADRLEICRPPLMSSIIGPGYSTSGDVRRGGQRHARAPIAIPDATTASATAGRHPDPRPEPRPEPGPMPASATRPGATGGDRSPMAGQTILTCPPSLFVHKYPGW